MSIKTHKYNSNHPTNSSSLVDLIKTGLILFQEINPTHKFGQTLMENGGQSLYTLLVQLNMTFDEFNTTSSRNCTDDKMLNNMVHTIWYQNHIVKGTATPLNQVSLISFAEILIKQLRNRIQLLGKTNLQTDYVAELYIIFIKYLSVFPDQKQRKINNLTILYEPYVDILKKGFEKAIKIN